MDQLHVPPEGIYAYKHTHTHACTRTHTHSGFISVQVYLRSLEDNQRSQIGPNVWSWTLNLSKHSEQLGNCLLHLELIPLHLSIN